MNGDSNGFSEYAAVAQARAAQLQALSQNKPVRSEWKTTPSAPGEAGAVGAIAALAMQAVRVPIVTHEHRAFLYSDSLGEYIEIPRVVVQTGSVANVECLAALVLEEAQRRSSSDGEFMTVTFDERGAVFSPDDRVRLDIYNYQRRLSPEWGSISGIAGRTYRHAEFLRLLQGLSSVLVTPQTVIRAFRSVDVSRVARIASSPTLQDGKAAVQIGIEVSAKVQGGGETTAIQKLPAELGFVLPYARGATRNTELVAELVVELAREGERETLSFGIVIPDLFVRERDARAAEVADFREAVKGLSRLLILENF